jgi:mycofactocin radical SAM maturase
LLGRLESKGLVVAELLPGEPDPIVTSASGNGHSPISGAAPASLHEQRLKAPVNVTWEITEVCNLSCRHCLSSDLRARGAGELDYAQCTAVVDQLAAMEVFQINFGGGEPFLRADFLDLLRYCQGKGITTCVSTNGTTLTEELVTELLEMEGFYLQVSLDGARAETNDAIRGRGTFGRIMAGARLLAGRRFPDYSLNMVVTRLNFDEIAEFRELAASLNAKTRLSRFRPSGGGCSTWDDYRLTREQLTGLSAYLGDHDEILTGDSFFALTPESRRAMGLQMCGAAKMTLALAPDGSVYPCAFLSDPAFRAGHVGDGPVDGAAAGAAPLADLFAHAPVLERLRDLEVASCRSCDRFSVCHGGCPAVAYFLTHSIGLPDPECLRAASDPLVTQITL